MRKFLAAVGLSLALLMPAQIVLAAMSEEKSVMAKLDEVEKEIKSLREALSARMASGKKMSSQVMSETTKMLDTFMADMKRFRKNRDLE
jgi:hypothetical protein